jgi:N-acetylneuraminic acid mutarotase
MVTIGDKLYVAGGNGPADPTEVWAYDPAANSWDTSLAPTSARRDHAAGTVVDGKFYLIGGRWEHSGNYATNEVYDPLSDDWEPRSDMPTPRSGLAADVIDGRIHVTGGEDIDVLCTYNRHEVYDLVTDSWERQPDLPVARHGLGSAVVNGRWYIVGGATGSGPNTQFSFIDRVDIFVPNEST